MSEKRRKRTGRLRAQADAIERRLQRAVRPNLSGPVLGAANIAYELSERTRGTAHGGIGMITKLVDATGLATEVDSSLELLKLHKPYHESDHVLNIAYNALCGGQRLQDIEARRCDAVFLDGLGTESLPDPTTAGDFCRRFDADAVLALQEAVNRARLSVWRDQPEGFFAHPAVIDADASIVATGAETKQGMDIAYNGIWGYSALVVSLANTKEPLYLGLQGANRPSHEGVVDYYDRAIALCRQAGFKAIRLRGDTDFALTAEFDRWDSDRVRFVFGYDARANLIETAHSTDEDTYHELVGRAERQIATTPRNRPRNIKDGIVRERNYKVLRQAAEDVVEFSYRPGKCKRDYRVVALRKNISVERGENVLFSEYRYFFYITNDGDMTADEIIGQARQRCNQENLISQLKSGVRALHAPVNTLCANWAYMTIAALAWTLKAWCALLLPITPRWAEQHNEQRRRLLTMDFRTFLAAFIEIPCQIITTGRRIKWRVLAYNQWLPTLFRLLDTL
ncbi:MAG TPA: IS1380 family transposase [Solirubrobacteraceae bacterium]|nr:IS1380 family transposase [Solirubrobacteraceae bacterium]